MEYWGTSHLRLSESYEASTKFIAGSKAMLGGITHVHFLDDRTLFKVHAAYSSMYTGNGEENSRPKPFDVPVRNTVYENKVKNKEQKVSTHISINKKMKSGTTLRIGVLGNFIKANTERENIDDGSSNSYDQAEIDYALLQGYAQLKWNYNDRLEVQSGLHTLFLTLNQAFHLEPRFAISWKATPNSSLSFAYGKQSQVPPSVLYLTQWRKSSNQPLTLVNTHLKYGKSNQWVLTFQSSPLSQLHLKLEGYYLQHYQIPDYPYSHRLQYFSGLNIGYDFGDDIQGVSLPLSNTGEGRSYGLEFTLEKYFGTSTYLLATASIYEAKYKGNWDIERNTAFNGNHTFNFLFSREWSLSFKRKSTLITNLSVKGAGGRRYTPRDPETGWEIRERLFEAKYRDYFRTDFKISIQQDFAGFTHHIGLDIRNLLNTRNVLFASFNVKEKRYIEFYQVGFLPLMIYEIEF